MTPLFHCSLKTLRVGARSSPLSQAQLEEVQQALNRYYPEITFEKLLVETYGDKDQKTSLRSLEKTDFFTREVDDLLLSGECRITIHSAKDLPDPISEGLTIAALTHGIDPSDVLVLRQGESFEKLPEGASIATSSERREQMVRNLRADLTFKDIRGTIGQRLEKLIEREVDGVVVAEAALIRLGLGHINRIILPGETTKYQGQLAIMARKDDREMLEIFRCLDCRLE